MQTRALLVLLPPVLCLACSVDEQLTPVHENGWSQWGQRSSHAGNTEAVGQRLEHTLGNVVYDPFVDKEKSDGDGDILIHYQTPLLDGPDVYMESKSGHYTACPTPDQPMPEGPPPPCGSDTWNQQEWSEKRFTWESGALIEKWSFKSDWHPPPDQGWLGGWEPVFHAALAGTRVAIPGAGGAIFMVSKDDGALIAHINPFGETLDPNTYVTGPLTVARDGTVIYNALALDAKDPWGADVKGAWLVKVSPDGAVAKVPFAALIPGAPTSDCRGGFRRVELPWPPSPDARPDMIDCGAQRPSVNGAPAVGPDGTIYTVSTAHFAHRYSYLVAVNPDLTPKWAASLRDRLQDGCGTPTLPPDGKPGGCRAGAVHGVDPATNELPAGIISDDSTASPVVAPDGTILYGAYTRYNYARGHLFQFSPRGEFLASYGFGWDVTPSIYEHDGTYSVIIKDNRYGTGSYCNDKNACPYQGEGPFAITQLSNRLVPEWSYINKNDQSCSRDGQGNLTCVSDHPDGFEWCINAPAVDRRGMVYANSEDGVLYAIEQGGALSQQIFLGESVGAAYTPLSIDSVGRIYSENLGQLFVIGQ